MRPRTGHIPHMREQNKYLEGWDVCKTLHEFSHLIFQGKWVYREGEREREVTDSVCVCGRERETEKEICKQFLWVY